MEILLCNDDGYYSKGIKELELALLDIANLTIVAPETNCSGASSSLTIKNPLRIRKFQDNGYYVNGYYFYFVYCKSLGNYIKLFINKRGFESIDL